MQTNDKRLHITCTQSDVDLVKDLAESEGMSISLYLRRLIRSQRHTLNEQANDVARKSSRGRIMSP